jgi:hypothetical protein
MQRDELTQKCLQLLILDAPEHVDSETNQFWSLRLPTFLPALVRMYNVNLSFALLFLFLLRTHYTKYYTYCNLLHF